MTGKNLKNYIFEGRHIFDSKKPFTRDIFLDADFPQKLGKIIIISGVRRAGKTMYLKETGFI